VTATDVTDNILRFAVFAADSEAMKAPPLSSVRNPDGSAQYETPAERTGRLVRAAVLHLIEQGLLVIPDDIDERLDRWIPVSRRSAPSTTEAATPSPDVAAPL
jgi:hypothetical protein